MASYRQFDLVCNRKRFIIRSSPRDGENKEAFTQAQERNEKINKSRKQLNAKIRSVIAELAERRWALMYLQYFANRVNHVDRVEIQFSDLPAIESLSLHEAESPLMMYKGSTKQHMEVLEQRKRDARIEMETSWAALNTLAVALASGIQGDPNDDELAFRLFSDESRARLFGGREDIRCSNWQEFGISRPLEREEAEGHIKGDHTKTDYISISTSPRRIWNLLNRDRIAKAGQKIAVLDLRVLTRLGIAYGSTTDDLKFHHYIKTNDTGTPYATKHHALVLGWLPPQCIMGFLSTEQFKALLEQAHIDTSTPDGIPLSEYEKKISFPLIQQQLLS